MSKLLLRILRAPETMTFALLIVALCIGGAMSPHFLDASYLLDKTSYFIPLGFTALAMTFVIISGNIDLSVASGAVLVAVLSAIVFERFHLPMPVIMLVAILLGALLGLFNGILICFLGLPSLVVTLGTLALYRGLAQVLIGERTIKGFPDWFVGIDYVKIAGMVPMPLILFLITAAIMGFILQRTTFGRCVFAIGTNEDATRYSAINTNRIKLAVFVISGISMGVAALVLISEIRTVDHKQLRGGELLAITAVVLGGTNIFGGRGSILGTVLALLLLVVVRSAMGVANVRAENQLAVIGTLLIASVLLSDIMTRLLARKRLRPQGA
ncbi:MAG TPA: ABC transporter permease [Tepidisphaeraceae bacterium]|jgi:rhamnose transport system permease protein